jgi:hypothetical protein
MVLIVDADTAGEILMYGNQGEPRHSWSIMCIGEVTSGLTYCSEQSWLQETWLLRIQSISRRSRAMYDCKETVVDIGPSA